MKTRVIEPDMPNKFLKDTKIYVTMAKEDKNATEKTLLEAEVEVETKTSWKNVLNWSMYDLANTIYSMVIVSLIINRYVLIIGQKEYGMSYDTVNVIFGTVVSAMQIIVAIGMPIMGALSDTVGKRKPFVIQLTGVILLFASLLGFTHNLTLVLIFYVIANIAYQWSLAFYDSMLAFIAAPKDVGKVGGFGVAFGYFGTILSLPVMIFCEKIWGTPVSQIPRIVEVSSHKLPENIQYGYYGYPWPFLIAMGMFFVLALPFLFVHERQKVGKRPKTSLLIKQTFRQLWETFKDIKKHTQMFIFIIGYFLFIDGANVIVAYMFPIVRDGMLMGETFGMVFIVLSTISAVIFTYFIGLFADKKGAKKAFYLVGGLWLIAIIIAIIAVFAWAPVKVGANLPFILVLLMGVLAGPALGGSWTAQRAMVATLAPKGKFGEYFGFSKFSGKLSSAIGPLVWSAAFAIFYSHWNYKTYGWAMFFIGLILLAGLIIIAFVKPEKAARDY